MSALLTESRLVHLAHDRLPRDLRMLERAMAEIPRAKDGPLAVGINSEARRILDIAGSHQPLDLVLDMIARQVERQNPGSLCSFVFDSSGSASPDGRGAFSSRKPQTHDTGLLGLARGASRGSHQLSAHVMPVDSYGHNPPGQLTLFYTAPPLGSITTPAIDMAMSLAAIAIRHRELWSDLNRQISERPTPRRPFELETDLRKALQNDELELFYQPQVDLNRQLVGMEALIRWNHPKLGMLLPDRFIRLAEETGLIVPIGGWVVAEACRQCADWNRHLQRPVKVGVNVSALQLYLSDLPEVVAACLQQSGLPANCLEIELTESVAMHDTDQSARALQKLRDLGVNIALDDFGTGYSSLSYLQALPVDALKIDKSFLHQSHAHAVGAVIEAITTLGRTLGLRIVAEGVETADQMARIQTMGVDVAQGYLIGRLDVGSKCIRLDGGCARSARGAA